MKLEFSRQVFEESPNIKFYPNPSRWSQVVPCDGQTDMKNLVVALRNFANAPKTVSNICCAKCFSCFRQSLQPNSGMLSRL
jgi:hypothetical protein